MQYSRETCSAVIKELQGRGIIERIEPGNRHTRKAAIYVCNLELIADAYYNLAAGRLCFTLQEARELNPKRRRQIFPKDFPEGTKTLLKQTSLTWNSKAALQFLTTQPLKEQVKIWRQIRELGSGPVKPLWNFGGKKGKTRRLIASKPAIQNLMKELRKPDIIAAGADLYEVDFAAQEPNIALALQGKPANFSYDKTPPETRKEFKTFLTAALHGQKTREFIYNYQSKHGQGHKKEAQELYKGLTELARQQGIMELTEQRGKELGQELQGIGADIFRLFLDIASRNRQDWTGALLPLHDGLIIEGESAAGDFYNYFKQASRDILGQELPVKPPAKLNP